MTLFQNLIRRMISLNPSERPNFEQALDIARDSAFPESFYSFLHSYVIAINETSSPSPFVRQVSLKPAGNSHETEITNTGSPALKWSSIPSDSDHRIERLWGEFDTVEPFLNQRIEDTVTKLHPRSASKPPEAYNAVGLS
jgi:phosphoinositide-3-kinase, regulatory subunit 4